MGQTNLEDTMREQLEKREITPSDAAWERISGKMDNHAYAKKGNKKLWLGIAASFIGGVLLTLFIVNQPAENNTLVDTPKNEQISTENVLEPTKTEESYIINTSKENKALVEESTNEQPEIINKPKINYNQQKLAKPTKPKTEVAVAIDSRSKSLSIEETEQSWISIDKTIKIEEAVVASENAKKLDLEVADLLKNAQRELVLRERSKNDGVAISAEELLLDVEADVDPETFRDKIFRKLKLGIKDAVEAVVDRNN